MSRKRHFLLLGEDNVCPEEKGLATNFHRLDRMSWTCFTNVATLGAESSSETLAWNDNSIQRTHTKHKEPVLGYNISHAIRTQDHKAPSWQPTSSPCTSQINATFQLVPTQCDEGEMRHCISKDRSSACPPGSFSPLPSCSPVAVSIQESGLR